MKIFCLFKIYNKNNLKIFNFFFLNFMKKLLFLKISNLLIFLYFYVFINNLYVFVSGFDNFSKKYCVLI